MFLPHLPVSPFSKRGNKDFSAACEAAVKPSCFNPCTFYSSEEGGGGGEIKYDYFLVAKSLYT